ncbi:kinase [Asticcacaulis sp. EMRT-3]|uniref:kinase n=1 Tax=Asticcacaulis sp. EMRT-3 TaxID=3040349 RepID=UPI0024AF85DF|nr:kinase [Asticcacaulis sp. EMRT-3]MDI7775076.1 kinase [Asticcacaulis sp. EMRT-3]
MTGLLLPALTADVTQRLKTGGARPLFIGLCGAQGSGKTTVTKALGGSLRRDGWRVATLSLDDLYLTHAARQRLSRDVHPLLATRGPPGTHDLALAQSVFDGLAAGRATRLPVFDKAMDDRRPSSEWKRVDGACDVVLFEGWCVGARSQAAADLETPINDLEKREDPDGLWRRYVNQALAGAYQDLFARLDMRILLAAPDFSIVARWRTEQEHALRRHAQTGTHIMSDAEVARFIQYYERLTRHILHEMPHRADLVVWLDAARQPLRLTRNPPQG